MTDLTVIKPITTVLLYCISQWSCLLLETAAQTSCCCLSFPIIICGSVYPLLAIYPTPPLSLPTPSLLWPCIAVITKIKSMSSFFNSWIIDNISMCYVIRYTNFRLELLNKAVLFFCFLTILHRRQWSLVTEVQKWCILNGTKMNSIRCFLNTTSILYL